MKIHFDIIQGSQQWRELRQMKLTASDLPLAIAAEKSLQMTIAEMEAITGKLSKGAKWTDYAFQLSLNFPDIYATNLDYSKIEKSARRSTALDFLSKRYKCDQKPESSNYWTERGSRLESLARLKYEQMTEREVKQAGFIDCGFYGCSPDGLIYDGDRLVKGLEIKCPSGEVHLETLLSEKMPREHDMQVHFSMICAEVKEWDFMSYCPTDFDESAGEYRNEFPPFLTTIRWNDFTDKLEKGLKAFIAEVKELDKRIKEKY
jgi:hypothetical protein